MARWELLKSLWWPTPTASGESCLWTAAGGLAFSTAAGVYGATEGVVAGLAAFVVLFPLGLVFQRRVELRGTGEEGAAATEEWEDGFATWLRSKTDRASSPWPCSCEWGDPQVVEVLVLSGH